MFRITVGINGEDYSTIQEALDAVPYETAAEIVISEGIYKEKIFSDKHSLSVRGVGKVVIIWSDSAREMVKGDRKRGTFRSYTAFLSGHFLHMENITIENGSGSGTIAGQGIALYLDVEKADLENVHIIGHQDTLFLSPLPDQEREKGGFYGPRFLSPRKRTVSIFRRCIIEGSVDFIFGSGDALFRDCEIISNEPGYVTAPSGKKEWMGLVFVSCSFTCTFTEKESVYLMRPWREEGKAAFISCMFGNHIASSPFIAWPGRDDEVDKATFILSGCTFSGPASVPSSAIISLDSAKKLIAAFPESGCDGSEAVWLYGRVES